MPEEERQRFAQAFAERGALQCGFCIPGIVMRAKSLIDKKGAGLAREDAARHLGAHLCRCTGYLKILDAVTERAPLHRNVDQLEVGGAALFLSSDLASGITGEITYVDCGYNITGL